MGLRTPVVMAIIVAANRVLVLVITACVLVAVVLTGIALVTMIRRLKAAQVRQSASQSELRAVLDTLTEGVQVFDGGGHLVSSNPAAWRIYDLDETETSVDAILATWELLDEAGEPRSVAEGPLAEAMRTGATAERALLGIRRRSDGTVRWLSTTVAPLGGAHQAVLGYVSCTRDITDRIETIRGLRILNVAAERLGASLVPDHVVTALTAAATEIGSVPGEPPRRAVLMMVDGDTLSVAGINDDAAGDGTGQVRVALTDHPYASKVIASGEPVVATFTASDFGPSASAVIRATEISNGALVPLTREGHVFAILAVSGRQAAVVSANQLDRLRALATTGALAFHNAEAHSRAEALARTDPLTGAANRRALDDRLRQLARTTFALVAIDVDHLKVVNDTYGHDAGDALLSTVASAMAAELRPADMLARTGGDEFVVVVVNCDATAASALARRLEAAVKRVPFRWGDASISVGIAAGVPGDLPGEVAIAADKALYAAKAHRAYPSPAAATPGRA